jgi:hypothetical protein
VIITPADYWRDERAKAIADRVLADAHVSPFDVFEIRLTEGDITIGRYRVADARKVNGKPVLTFKIGPDGVETYRTIKTRHGWVDTEHDGAGGIPVQTLR